MSEILYHARIRTLLVLLITGILISGARVGDVLGQRISNENAKLVIEKLEPPNWWVGMKRDEIELLIYGQGFKDATFQFDSDQLQISESTVSENGTYAFIKFQVPSDLSFGNYKLNATVGNSHASVEFPIQKRASDAKRHQGFDVSDILYLITPDRFSNGDENNDRVVGIRDEFDRKEDGARHGGDLVGIERRLDYLVDLGVTTLWLNPVLENRGKNSYHGYAATDLYRVDPRFGSNEDYLALVEAAHSKGIKVIFDHISNHIGIEHPWIKNPPEPDWFNGSTENHLTNKHYLHSILDPHADAAAPEMLKTFWFVDAMPDVNQRNKRIANYLIQNTIWWIEYSGLDGIREDTYPYNDQAFITEWAKAVRHEYPSLNIVGEVWNLQPGYIAQFQEKSKLPRSFETALPAVMDFPLMKAYRDFLEGEGKLRDVHEMYAQDFLYTDLNNLLVFLDNHDISRAIFHAKGNVERLKIALTLMMTCRGIPQILYGTEIGMVGGESHIQLRADFPGGFPFDKQNAFDASTRTKKQAEMFDFCQWLFRLRKEHAALSQGKMIHYAPTWNDDTYKVIKHLDDETILIVANGNEFTTELDLSELSRWFDGVSQLVDLESRKIMPWSEDKKLKLPAMTAKLWLLKKQ